MSSLVEDEPNVDQHPPLESSHLAVRLESTGEDGDFPQQQPSLNQPPLAIRTLEDLPVEIYLRILDERYYQGSEAIEGNQVKQVDERRRVLVVLALVSRRVNNIVTPLIYSAFSMGDGRYQRDHRTFDTDDRQPALFLRTLLERPDLAREFKSVHIPEKEIGTWDPDESKGNGIKVAIWLGPPPKEAEHPWAPTLPSRPAQAPVTNNLLYDTEPEDDGSASEDVLPPKTSAEYEREVWFDQQPKEDQDTVNRYVEAWDIDNEEMGTVKANLVNSDAEGQSGSDDMELDEAGRSSLEEGRGGCDESFKRKRDRWLRKHVFNGEAEVDHKTSNIAEDHDKKGADKPVRILMRESSSDPDGPPKGTIFKAPDLRRVEAAIRKLCERPVWHFPAGQPTDWLVWGEFYNQSWFEEPDHVRKIHEQPLDAPYDKELFAEDWIRCFKDGHYDAVYALLLSLMPGITSFRLERWCTNWAEDGMPPARLVNDYISQFFRAVAQSQRNALIHTPGLSEMDHGPESNADCPLLPKLRDIILYHASDQSRIPIALAIPYLLPPSVERATLVGIWDPSWFPTGRYPVYLDEHGVQEPGTGADSPEISQMHPRELPVLNLKMLRLRRSLLSAESMGKLIKCCPKLEWLSYGQNKQPTFEGEPVAEIDLDVRILQPYLDLLKPTLKYIDFAVNGERDTRCWHLTTDNPDRMEIWKGYFHFSGFEKLYDITVNCENFLDHSEQAISNPDVYQDLAAILPLRTLKTLIIHNSLWAGPWDGIVRAANESYESRLVRLSQCFVNMLRRNESIVLEKLVFVAQGDVKGADLFWDYRPLVVDELVMLCNQRRIQFRFKCLLLEEEAVDEDEIWEAMSKEPGTLGPLDSGIQTDDPEIKKFLKRVTSPCSEEGVIRSSDEEGGDDEEREDGDEDEEGDQEDGAEDEDEGGEDVAVDDHFMGED